MKRYFIDYDSQADAAYIKVSKGKVADSVESGKDIMLDLDKNKKVIGIEILNFSKMRINLGSLIAKQFQNVAVVK
jgi:uncharacterized protein YuzE